MGVKLQYFNILVIGISKEVLSVISHFDTHFLEDVGGYSDNFVIVIC